jgi:hypothetical protein
MWRHSSEVEVRRPFEGTYFFHLQGRSKYPAYFVRLSETGNRLVLAGCFLDLFFDLEDGSSEFLPKSVNFYRTTPQMIQSSDKFEVLLLKKHTGYYVYHLRHH